MTNPMQNSNGGRAASRWLMTVLGGVTVAAVCSGAGVIYGTERRMDTAELNMAVIQSRLVSIDASLAALLIAVKKP